MAALCLAAGDMRTAKAQLTATLSVNKTREPDGRFHYEYRVDNPPISTVTVNAFVLDVGEGADLQSLTGPADWSGEYDPEELTFELAFVSEGPEFDIPVGGSGVFSLTSPLDAAPLNYFVANLGPGDTDNGSIFGKIDSPASFIPEPSTGFLLLLTVPAIVIRRQTVGPRRKRSSQSGPTLWPLDVARDRQA